MRVQFHVDGVAPLGRVRAEFVVPSPTPQHVLMKGTALPPHRCVLLDGTPGEHTTCTRYDDRPSPCRSFEASWENGTPNPHCDDARAVHGLPPLTPATWA
jgi:Fe-S-cluster containining protein